MGLLSWLTGRKPKAPPPPPPRNKTMNWGGRAHTGGYKGFAIGSREEPDYSPENIAQRQRLSQSEVDGFVYEGDLLVLHSSWLASSQYHHADQKLMVEFLDGAAVLVDDVSEEEAFSFAAATSKGSWYWDNVLGKEYIRESGISLKSWTVLRS